MIADILGASGLPYRETQFMRPPAGTYAVYMDDVDADGPDGLNRIFTHDLTVELYEPKPDPQAEAAVERELDARGLHYRKQPRFWVEQAQRYQVIYEFTYIVKS